MRRLGAWLPCLAIAVTVSNSERPSAVDVAMPPIIAIIVLIIVITAIIIINTTVAITIDRRHRQRASPASGAILTRVSSLTQALVALGFRARWEPCERTLERGRKTGRLA